VTRPAGGPPATVRIDPGGRPAESTRVVLPTWEGPLGLLLALIESRQLDVRTVPLADLAGAYLEALASLEVDRLEHLSAFVAIAGQLVLLKSRALLPLPPAPPVPSPEEEPDPEGLLRRRLLLYRAFRDAGRRLEALAQERIGVFSRDPTAAAAEARSVARPAPAPPLDPRLLLATLEPLLRGVPPPPVPVRRAVTLAERIAVLRLALARADVVVLQELLAGLRDRIVVAVTFLALLELVKGREAAVEQERPFGPIVVRRVRRTGELAGGREAAGAAPGGLEAAGVAEAVGAEGTAEERQ
jgi:segregation and condensation protein A